ncbi:MAG: hypothetical protein EOM67_15500, partial [Spirochaetia bacterium]|nr:hypothetical protein [Spirochaetia bacterium]
MQDKQKVAKVIADMLGVSSYRTPEQAINSGLKAAKNTLSKELIPTLRKMLDLASEVGIAYDKTLVPKGLHEGAVEVETGSVMSGHVDVMQPAPVMRYKEYVKKKTAPHMDNHEDDPHTESGSSLEHTEDDQLRRRKVDYKINEDSDELDEDVASADYKVSKSGHKYRAHHITFKNSRSGGKLADDPDEEEDENIVVKEEIDVDDISDDDLEDMADEVDDEEDVLDVYDDDELSIIDTETGEEVDEEGLDESVLNARYPMPLAETASIFCETIVVHAALKQASEQEQIAIL